MVRTEAMPFVATPYGSAKNIDGRTIFFSFERFKEEICNKGHCFVCGAHPSE